MDFLDGEKKKYVDLSNDYEEMGRLYKAKLWHQLTECLMEFVKNGSKGTNLVDLYDKFLNLFEAKINQLKFVQLMSIIANEFLKSTPSTGEEIIKGVQFLERVSEKRARIGEDAYVYVQVSIAKLYILFGSGENLSKAKSMLTQAQSILSNISGVDAVVNSLLCKAFCSYYMVVGPADEYYKFAIQYLAYSPLETLSSDEQIRLAVDISLAAIVADTVFNFGEVLSQPILSKLQESRFPWLRDMLRIFSSGDIDAFADICRERQNELQATPALAANMELLRQKISLLALMQMIFELPPESRTIKLCSIATVTRLPVDQVEWLLMRAMSKSLIKGQIDQIEQVVNITWLKPRVLDIEQMKTLTEKLGSWNENVDKTLLFFESETPELFQ